MKSSDVPSTSGAGASGVGGIRVGHGGYGVGPPKLRPRLREGIGDTSLGWPGAVLLDLEVCVSFLPSLTQCLDVTVW